MRRVTGRLEDIVDARVRVRGHASGFPKTYPVTEAVAAQARALLGREVTLDLDAWGVGVRVTDEEA